MARGLGKHGIRTLITTLSVVLLGCQTPTAMVNRLNRPAPKTTPLAPALSLITQSAEPVNPTVAVRATLYGTIQAPASLVRNNGGGIIGNNGGGYRLLALAQVPLANVTVAVLDAAGKPIIDASGQPLKATTNERGEYALFTELPAKNLILRVELAENRGTMQALAAKDSRDVAVPMDLISTLVTAYILERYVASQTDQQQVLDRLPGSVERETRNLAQSAFTSSNAPIPPVLDATTTITAVNALRKANGGFDEQMERVKRLFIAAGQSGLGEGRLATTVGFRRVDQIFDGPDGSTYIRDGRLWRVRPDGILETAVGGGNLEPEAADGKFAKEVNNDLEDFSLDSANRIVARYSNGIVRVEKDGTVKVLASRLPGRMIAVVPGAGDTVWYVAQAPRSGRGTGSDVSILLFELTPGQAPIESGILNIPGNASNLTIGFDSALGLLAHMSNSATHETYRINTDNASVTLLREGQAGTTKMDHKGRLSLLTNDGRVGILPLTGDEPLWFEALVDYPLLSVGYNGQSMLVMDKGILTRVSGLGTTVVAGTGSSSAVTGQARDLALFDTTALTIDPNGTLYLFDRTRGKLLRIDPAQNVTEVPLNIPDADPDYGHSIYSMRLSDNGDIIASWGLPALRLIRIQPNGQHEDHFKEPVKVIDYLVRPGGELIVMSNERNGPSRIGTWGPGGGLTPLYTGQIETKTYDMGDNKTYTASDPKPNLGNRNLVPGPDGMYWIFGQGELLRWKPGSDPELVKKDRHFFRFVDDNEGSLRDSVTVGPQGVLYFAAGYGYGDGSANRIGSYDPVKDELRIIAGNGGVIFNGTGVDDQLQDPYNPVFEPSGALLFIDNRARQIKRIPKDKLVGNLIKARRWDDFSDGE